MTDTKQIVPERTVRIEAGTYTVKQLMDMGVPLVLTPAPSPAGELTEEEREQIEFVRHIVSANEEELGELRKQAFLTVCRLAERPAPSQSPALEALDVEAVKEAAREYMEYVGGLEEHWGHVIVILDHILPRFVPAPALPPNRYRKALEEIGQISVGGLSESRKRITQIVDAALQPNRDVPGICGMCGEPMPKGEEMFKYHGYSGPCPTPPTPKPALPPDAAALLSDEAKEARDYLRYELDNHTDPVFPPSMVEAVVSALENKP